MVFDYKYWTRFLNVCYTILIMYIRQNMFRGDSYVKRETCEAYG